MAHLLCAGDVVLLVGSLGAGKTTFVQGLVAALGGREPVTSPTFTLAHKYRTSPPVTHVDLWRLGHLQEVVDLALEEELDEGGVVVVEWGEAAEPLYGADALVVRLAWGRSDSERTIAIEAHGASFVSRLAGYARRRARDSGHGSGGRGSGGHRMRILAIETATIEVGVAVADETGVLASVTARPGRRQAETLHPAIADACRIRGLRWRSSTP